MVLEKINWYLCKPLVALSSTRKMHSLQIHNCKILSIAQYFLSSLTICVMHLFLRTHNFQFVHIVQFVFRLAFKKFLRFVPNCMDIQYLNRMKKSRSILQTS